VRKKALSLSKDSSLRVVKDFLLKKDRFQSELGVCPCRLLYHDIHALLSEEGDRTLSNQSSGGGNGARESVLLCLQILNQGTAAERKVIRLKPGMKLHMYISQAPCKFKHLVCEAVFLSKERLDSANFVVITLRWGIIRQPQFWSRLALRKR
jgi:hypothetical protein